MARPSPFCLRVIRDFVPTGNKSLAIAGAEEWGWPQLKDNGTILWHDHGFLYISLKYKSTVYLEPFSQRMMLNTPSWPLRERQNKTVVPMRFPEPKLVLRQRNFSFKIYRICWHG
jgi:hypothetical protein